MGFSSQSGHVAFRTQSVAGTFPADFATNAVAMKLKTGALAANRDLLIPDPEIGGGRDINDAFLGAVTFTGDYQFYARLNGLTTLLYAALGQKFSGPSGTQDVQTITITGVPTGGTFTLTYSAQTTAAIPYNATAAQVQTALAALSNIGDYDVVCTGGPLPATGVVVTFDGALNGTVSLITQNSAGLTGGSSPTVVVTHTTTGVSNAAGKQWLFVPVDGQLPFLGIEEQISNTMDIFQYTDAVVNTLHFECDANGYFMGTAGMIARIQTALNSGATDVTNLTDNLDMIVGTNVSVSFGGTTLAAKSMKFDLNNNFAADDFRLGSFFIGDLTAKRRECTIGVNIREQDKNLWRQATYGSSSATTPGGVIVKNNVIVTASTYLTIPGSSPTIAYSLSLLMPSCAIKPYALKVSGDDIIDSDIEFQALRPVPTTPLIRAKVNNLLTAVA
jgi:hypothetical protein